MTNVKGLKHVKDQKVKNYRETKVYKNYKQIKFDPDNGMSKKETKYYKKYKEMLHEYNQNMYDKFYKMLEKYKEQKQTMVMKPNWKNNKSNDIPYHPYTITNLDFTNQIVNNKSNRNQNNFEWLQGNTIVDKKLTIKDLLKYAQILKPEINPENGKIQQKYSIDNDILLKFEMEVTELIEDLIYRIKYMLSGSRRIFGMISPINLTIIVDFSRENFKFNKIETLKNSILHLIDDQLEYGKNVEIIFFNDKIFTIWPFFESFGKNEILLQMDHFINSISFDGTCNLLNVFRTMKTPTLALDETCNKNYLLVLGSEPNQDTDVIINYINQKFVGFNVTFDTVSFDCSNSTVNNFLHKLSNATGGRFHIFENDCFTNIFNGSDFQIIINEIGNAQNHLSVIKDIKRGILGNTLIKVYNKIEEEKNKLPHNRFMLRPTHHLEKLIVEEISSFESSKAWLKMNGIKANNLNLYSVLAPNAYNYCYSYVNGKKIKSQTLARAMVQMEWPNGTIKNVHVDAADLYIYQSKLGAMVRIIEDRIHFLLGNEKLCMGCLTEKNIILLVDTCGSNLPYLIYIQHTIRLILEYQTYEKSKINIVAYNSATHSLYNSLVTINEKKLQELWKWVLSWRCEGSRNLLSALKFVVENDDNFKTEELVGIYIITSGQFDQNTNSIQSYINSLNILRPFSIVNTILFTIETETEALLKACEENDSICRRELLNLKNTISIKDIVKNYQNMCSLTDGRFHWTKENGSIVSNDLKDLNNEIKIALEYSKKCTILMESLKLKNENIKNINNVKMENKKILIRPISNRIKELAISNKKIDYNKKDISIKYFYTGKKLNKANIDARNPQLSESLLESHKKFYNSVCKLPESSKQWLYKYGVKKLKLNVVSMIRQYGFSHTHNYVKTIQKSVDAKFCVVLPKIKINGYEKHLKMNENDLKFCINNLNFLLVCYLKRYKWLLKGTRYIFGNMIEKNVIILVDLSGSMEIYKDSIMQNLKCLIWDQFHNSDKKFNFVKFSNTVSQWQENVVLSDKAMCLEAIDWISNFNCDGSTDLIDALKICFDQKCDGIYLLSDGKSDTSIKKSMQILDDFCLNNVNTKINCVAFEPDEMYTNFLKSVSNKTDGRYQVYGGNSESITKIKRLKTQQFLDFLKNYYRELNLKSTNNCKKFSSDIQIHRSKFKTIEPLGFDEKLLLNEILYTIDQISEIKNYLNNLYESLLKKNPIG